MNSESRQKRDVRDAMMIGQVEKKAADLMKKLDAKEGQLCEKRRLTNIANYYTMRSQSLFRELQIILDILLCVERGRIAEGVILICALRGRIPRNERSTAE